MGQRGASGLTRRRLLRSAFWSVAVGGGAGGVVGALRYLRAPIANRVVYLPPELLPAAGDPPRYVADGQFYVVYLTPGEALASGRYGPPVVSPGGLLVLSARERLNSCPERGFAWTHAYREPGFDGAFMDPCRHAAFNKAGVDFYGPAWRPMATLGASFDTVGGLLVDTADVRPGGADNPLRTVRP